MEQSTAAQHIIFLRFLLKASTAQQNWLLKHLTNDQLDAIGEVAYNLLFGDKDVSSIKQHQRIIRVLGDKKASRQSRRKLAAKYPRVVLQGLRLALE